MSIDEFRKQKGFKVVHLNVRSFFSKKESIEHDLLDGTTDILGLSETWLKEGIPNTMLNISKYQLVRQDRQQKKQFRPYQGWWRRLYVY